MRYNFNAPVDRSKNYSAKYDELEKRFGRSDLIPLWIADMDLVTAKPIIDAMDARNRQGIFGYTSRPDSYFKAVCSWQLRRNGWKVDPSLVSFGLGVVPLLCTLVREFSNPGDSILFLTPVYSEFYDSVVNWGRKPMTVELDENDGYYTLNMEKFEEALKKKPAFFIHCNPHNPVGRVWTKEELTQIGELCVRYGVTIVSDEIHSDLILYGNKHIPMACVSQEVAGITITGISATKTFNLAGLQACTAVFPNKDMKAKYDSFWQRMDVHRNNCFSLVAMETAFSDPECENWLTQLLRHLEENIDFVAAYLADNIPEIKVRKPQCTYLLWLDCRGLGLKGDDLPDFMVEEARLALNDGRSFGDGGEGFMRLNVACPKSILEKALKQLKTAVDKHLGK